MKNILLSMNVLLQYILSNDNCYIKILLYHILNVYKKNIIYVVVNWKNDQFYFIQQLFNFYVYVYMYFYIICRMSKIESNVCFMLRKQNV